MKDRLRVPTRVLGTRWDWDGDSGGEGGTGGLGGLRPNLGFYKGLGLWDCNSMQEKKEALPLS